MLRRAFAPVLLAGVLACSASLAQIEVRDVRITHVSATDGHLVVEVDVRATEGGGRHLGIYCVEVNFPGETVIQRICDDDLTDGDTKTVRIVSELPIASGGTIAVAARLANYIDSRTSIAP